MRRLLALACVALFSCGDHVTLAPPSGAPPVIRFAISLDISGNTGTSASSALPAIRTLENQVNALGGIEGRRVEFLQFDDRGDHGDAIVTLFQGLIDQKALGVVGPINSGQVTQIAATAKNKMIVISPSATASNLSSLNDSGNAWIFRTVPNDDLQAKAMVKFAASKSCTKLAVAYLDDKVYGAGIEAQLESLLPASTFAGSVTLSPNAKTDYRSEVEAIAALSPSCLVVVAYDDVGGPFSISLRSYLDANPAAFPASFFVIGSDGLRANGFLEKSKIDANSAANDIFYGTAPDPNPQRQQLADFKKLRSQFDDYQPTLDPFAASAYDAAALLVLARALAGVDDPGAVRDALLQVASDGTPIGPANLGQGLSDPASLASYDYNGASGDCDFLPGGDVLAGYEIWHVVNNVFAVETQYRAEDIQ